MPLDGSNPLEIQALFFDVADWSRGAAADWCEEHGHAPVTWRQRTDETGQATHHIAVLFEPDLADPESFVTLADDFPAGVSACMATRKAISRSPKTRAIDAIETRAGQQSEDDPMEFVLSDESVDRMGDIIEADGWRLADFKRNPIALFAHDHRSILGTWQKVRVEGGRLLGRLKLAEPGTSQLVDEVGRLIEQRILRAVSVGFRPIQYEEILDKSGNWTGYRFLVQALHEVSVVAVPANANALAVAKSLDISPATRRLIFADPAPAKPGQSGALRNTTRGEPADRSKTIGGRKKAMGRENDDGTLPLAEQIKAKERALTRAEVELEQLQADVLEADGEVTDDQEKRIDELNEIIEKATTSIERLKKFEQRKAGDIAARSGVIVREPRDGDIIRGGHERSRPEDKGKLFVRWVAANVYAMQKGVRLEQAAEKLFGPMSGFKEKGGHNRVLDFHANVTGSVERAAVAPAMTNVAGWAAELVGEEVQGFIESLAPDAVLPKLLSRPSVITANFGPGVGSVMIPVEGDVARPIGAPPGTPQHAAGEFFAEGAPIRVARFTIEEMTLSAKETGVIVPWTRKLEMYSSIDLVAYIERVIRRQTARRLDDILLSAIPMDSVYPQGLADPAIPGFTTTAFTPATAGKPTYEEIETALSDLLAALGPNAIDPVLIMSQEAARSLGNKYRMPTGPRVFADELANGTLMQTPYLTHNTGPIDVVFALDAGRFIAAYGAPDFDISSDATLHMENTLPLPIVSGTGTVAQPVRSLFQTASRAVRMILDTSWAVGGVGRSHQLTGFDV